MAIFDTVWFYCSSASNASACEVVKKTQWSEHLIKWDKEIDAFTYFFVNFLNHKFNINNNFPSNSETSTFRSLSAFSSLVWFKFQCVSKKKVYTEQIGFSLMNCWAPWWPYKGNKISSIKGWCWFSNTFNCKNLLFILNRSGQTEIILYLSGFVVGKMQKQCDLLKSLTQLNYAGLCYTTNAHTRFW